MNYRLTVENHFSRDCGTYSYIIQYSLFYYWRPSSLIRHSCLSEASILVFSNCPSALLSFLRTRGFWVLGSETPPKGYIWSIRIVEDFHINKFILYQLIKITSYQLAGTSWTLCFSHRLFNILITFFLNHCSHWLFKDLFKTFSCKSTAFNIFAF